MTVASLCEGNEVTESLRRRNMSSLHHGNITQWHETQTEWMPGHKAGLDHCPATESTDRRTPVSPLVFLPREAIGWHAENWAGGHPSSGLVHSVRLSARCPWQVITTVESERQHNGLEIPALLCSGCVFQVCHEVFVPSAPPRYSSDPCVSISVCCTLTVLRNGTTPAWAGKPQWPREW